MSSLCVFVMQKGDDIFCPPSSPLLHAHSIRMRRDKIQSTHFPNPRPDSNIRADSPPLMCKRVRSRPPASGPHQRSSETHHQGPIIQPFANLSTDESNWLHSTSFYCTSVFEIRY
jgi:hypothetical protein